MLGLMHKKGGIIMILEKVNRAYKLSVIFMFLLLFIWIASTYAVSVSRVIGVVRPTIRSIENRIVLYRTRNFNEVVTDDFIFRYENIDQQTLDLIISTAEDKYGKYCQ